jgi:hypothetical protein
MNFNFGEILTRSWQIIWKHKILWVFGVLASCSRGGGGGSGGGGGGGGGGGNGFDPGDVPQFSAFEQWLNENWWIFVIAVLAIVLVFALVAIFLGTIGRIGLIKGTYQAEQGAESLVLGELFSGSMPYFWRVFGLSFLIGLAFLIILLPFFAFGVLSAGVGFLCLLPLICILVPISWVVTIIIEQANTAIVLDDLTLMDGLRRGWEVVRGNLGPTLIMGLILFVISAVVGVVVALPIFLIVFPAMLGYFAGGGESTTPLIVMTVCFCLYLPVAVVLQGVMVAYTGSAWTLTYLRLTRPQGNAPVALEANA